MKKTGNDLDTAAKHLNDLDQDISKRIKELGLHTGEDQEHGEECGHMEFLREHLPGAIDIVMTGLEHMGEDGIVVLSINERTGEKYKTTMTKKKISDVEFLRVKAEEESKGKTMIRGDQDV